MSYFKSKEGSLESSINEVSKHLKITPIHNSLKKNFKKLAKVLLQCPLKKKKTSLTK